MLPQNNPDRIRIVFDDHRLLLTPRAFLVGEHGTLCQVCDVVGFAVRAEVVPDGNGAESKLRRSF